MSNIGLVLLLIYGVITFMIQLGIFMTVDTISEIVDPSITAIHNATKMNWFGCTVVAILYWIVCPLFAIYYFIYWLFHVGRRNDEEDKDVPVI